MKEVILHIGFHKTGSSSIQSTCAENRKTLNKEGICYPVFNYQGKKIKNHSIPLYSLFAPYPQDFHINLKWEVNVEDINREYRKQLEKILSTEEKIILSGESMSALPEDSLYSLKQYFEEHGFRITPIAFVRSPISYQISAAQERVKNGNTVTFSEIYFPSKKIKKLQSVFSGNINFYPFRQVCSHEFGPAGFFLNLIGLSEKYLKKIIYSEANISLSDQATRMIAYINEVEPFYIIDLKSGKRIINPNRSYRDTFAFQKIGNTKFRPILSEIQHILQKAEQENEWLRDNLGEEYCDNKIDLEFNDLPFSWDRDNMQQLLDVLAECPVPLRNLAIDYLENNAISDRIEKFALRRRVDEIKIPL